MTPSSSNGMLWGSWAISIHAASSSASEAPVVIRPNPLSASRPAVLAANAPAMPADVASQHNPSSRASRRRTVLVGIGAALVLIVIVMALNLLARLLGRIFSPSTR